MEPIDTQTSNRSLIASDRVEGTAVYNRQGEKLGTVSNLMIDKRSGHVEYAVMSFGGLFGMGGDRHPLPWDVLDYVPEQGGYVVELDKAMLDKAPKYDTAAEPDYDEAYQREVRGYYNMPFPY